MKAFCITSLTLKKVLFFFVVCCCCCFYTEQPIPFFPNQLRLTVFVDEPQSIRKQISLLTLPSFKANPVEEVREGSKSRHFWAHSDFHLGSTVPAETSRLHFLFVSLCHLFRLLINAEASDFFLLFP